MGESEKYLERKLKLITESKDGMCIKLPAIHLRGIPDRLCILPNGVVFFAEIKTTGKKPRAIQVIMQNRIKMLGFPVYVVDSSESIHAIEELHTIRDNYVKKKSTS